MKKNSFGRDILSGIFLRQFLRTMKLTLFILISSALSLFASGTYSQNARVSLDLKNVSVKDALKAIENSSEFFFIYNNELINVDRKIDVNAKEESIGELLNTIFKDQGVDVTVVDRKIVLAPSAIGSQQPGRSITGKVTDQTGAPVPGASVVVKGTTVGVTTAADGGFTLVLPKNAAALLVTFVGMRMEEVALSAKSDYKIVLTEDVVGLSEVVAVGYGTSSRKKLASAIASVNPEELLKGSFVDVGRLLQGKVAGMNVTVSGDPNQRATVILRGVSTLNSSQTPFYVIDGIPGADISTVAPTDIASIDVLKDAAATSIYGNRASNGVIIINTKKGKKGDMHITYSGYVTNETVSNSLKMMNADQLRAFATANGQSFSPSDDKNAHTDWQKAVQRSAAYAHNHNISFSGGGDHNSYSASVNFIEKQGLILTSKNSNVITRLNLEQSVLNDKVKLGFTGSYADITANMVPQLNSVLTNAVRYLPVSPVYNNDGSYFENFGQTNSYYNPVSVISHAKNLSKYQNFVGGFNGHVLLPFGLTYDINLSYQAYNTLHGEFYDKYYANYSNAQFSFSDPGGGGLNSGLNGSAERSFRQNRIKLLETFLTWDKKIGGHTINAMIGYSWQSNVYGDGFQATSTNFPVDNIGYNNLALSNYTAVPGYRVSFGNDGVYQEQRLISDFARLNYNYKSKYMLQASMRKDGSSVFGANNQWGYFPSVGLAWRVKEEKFMQNQTIFNDLKVRASYGETGNASGFNAYTAQFASGSQGTFYYNGNQVGAYGPTQAANPDLRWEKTTTSNVGIDFTILKGKVEGTLEWYDKETNGMIYSYSVDPILVPTGSITANGGSMSNKGYELSLSATPVNNKIFTWNSKIVLAHNENMIKSLTNPLFFGGDSIRVGSDNLGPGQTGSSLEILKSGHPLGQFFTFEYAGKNANGVSQYLDKNGNLTTTPVIGTDYKYSGNAQPKLLLGWNNDFKYKNFDLNIFFRGVFGNKIMNVTRADLFRPSTVGYWNILEDAASESSKDVNSYRYSSRFIEDGSYLRLENATLGYNYPAERLHLKQLRIYMSVNNLFILTKYKGVDPEITQGGITPGIDANNFYPKTRVVLLGVNLTF